MESIPAYMRKRQQSCDTIVEEEPIERNETSHFSIKKEDGLNNKNGFLHDNVD